EHENAWNGAARRLQRVLVHLPTTGASAMKRKPFAAQCKSLAALMLASSFALVGSMAQAQSGQPARSDASRSASGVEFTSGGVGLAARQQLAAQSGQYNLQLEFAYAPEGEYLSAVQVDIADARGNNVLSTVTDGPWLMAKLPAGNYTVKARFGSATRTQQVNVGPRKQRVVMQFPASAEQAGAMSSDRRNASMVAR
ncbi:MAG: carboxypeptidase-like regulatory domain-containing protein, partial [Burkholderiales bacterium]